MPRPTCPDHAKALRAVYSRRGASGTFVRIPTAWECAHDGRIYQPTDLAALLDHLRQYGEDDGLDWTDLPTYGGNEPADTTDVWSWDATHLLVGTDQDNLEIVARDDW